MKRVIIIILSIFVCSIFLTFYIENYAEMADSSKNIDKKEEKIDIGDNTILLGEYCIDLDKGLDEELLKKLNKCQIAILRNGIFAKHGYIFNNKDYKNYFSQYKWYNPKYNDVENLLTKSEKETINKYLLLEQEKTIIVPKEIINIDGEEYEIYLTLDDPVAIYQNGSKYYCNDNSLQYYSNIIINKIHEDRKQEVFNLKKLGYTIEGIKEGDRYFDIVDKNEDGHDELYFYEQGYASSVPRKLIISKMDEEFKILFFGEITQIKYIDVDNDGFNELYGMTEYGGQTSFDKGFFEVFKFIDSEYKFSYDLTWKYECRNMYKYNKSLEKKTTTENLIKMLDLYGYLGLTEKWIETKNKYSDLLKEIQKNIPYFRNNQMPQYYKELWQNIKLIGLD